MPNVLRIDYAMKNRLSGRAITLRLLLRGPLIHYVRHFCPTFDPLPPWGSSIYDVTQIWIFLDPTPPSVTLNCLFCLGLHT